MRRNKLMQSWTMLRCERIAAMRTSRVYLNLFVPVLPSFSFGLRDARAKVDVQVELHRLAAAGASLLPEAVKPKQDECSRQHDGHGMQYRAEDRLVDCGEQCCCVHGDIPGRCFGLSHRFRFRFTPL